MKRTQLLGINNLAAKVASLILAIAIWFLISDHLDSQRQNGISADEDIAIGLGPAVNPDLQGAQEVKEEPEKPTAH